MKETYILKPETLNSVNNSTLFYPCSGNDLSVPIELFAPFITDFWFVDRGYFTPGHQDTKRYQLDLPADVIKPTIKDSNLYKFIDKTIVGRPSGTSTVRTIKPCVLTEQYLHLPTGLEFRIHRRRGYGFCGFRKEIRSLGVFFYRGDSMGEGGSGNLWLNPKHLNNICDKLIDGGLIVTDGSNHGKDRNGSILGENYWAKHPIPGKEAMDCSRSFTDDMGRQFNCVGYAGNGYGPTLIWQVHKTVQCNQNQSTNEH